MNDDSPAKPDFRDKYTWLATWFGCGLMKPGPGTWGTLGGVPFAVIFLVLGGPVAVLLAALCIYLIGERAAHRFEQTTGTHDSGMIVIDEVVGVMITLAAALPSPLFICAGFVLFRLFDILKPWPVSYFDRMPGARGVMLDDVAAGILAAVCLLTIELLYFFPSF
jgi:phosphatidylglycerophosphatase A